MDDLGSRAACRSPVFLDSLPAWNLELRPLDNDRLDLNDTGLH